MIPKSIIYSDHAAAGRDRRGFTRADVRWLLARGERSKAPTVHGAQRWQAVGYVRNREARVVFIETAYQYLLVSVQWADEKKGES